MTQDTRAKRKGTKEVASRVGTALWLLAILLVVDWGSAGGFQVRSEVPGVSPGTASLTSEARPARPSLLPRGSPRLAALETDRQKAIRGPNAKSFGINSEEAPLPLVAHHASTPIPRSGVLCSAPVRAFEARGPPRLIA
jgi:hypothetical protein